MNVSVLDNYVADHHGMLHARSLQSQFLRILLLIVHRRHGCQCRLDHRLMRYGRRNIAKCSQNVKVDVV